MIILTGLQVPLRGFMQKRIREPYSKQLGLEMARVKCLQFMLISAYVLYKTQLKYIFFCLL